MRVFIVVTTAVVLLLIAIVAVRSGSQRTRHDDSPGSGLRVNSQGADHGTVNSRSGNLNEAKPGDALPANTKSGAVGGPPPARLSKFKKWHTSWMSKEYGKGSTADTKAHFTELLSQAEELRSLALTDSDAFLSFIRDPENEQCVSDLLNASLSKHQRYGESWMIVPQDYSELPSNLMTGLRDLMVSGTDGQRIAIMRVALHLKNTPAEFQDDCRSLLGQSNEEVRAAVTDILRYEGKLTPADLRSIRGNAEVATTPELRRASYFAIASTGSNDEIDWLVGQLSQKQDTQSMAAIAEAIRNGVVYKGGIPTTLETKTASAVMTALGRSTSKQTFDDLLYIGLNLPSTNLGPLLQLAIQSAPNDELRRGVEASLRLYQEGERNAGRLLKTYATSKKAQ